jgi:hypothetical protein
MSQEVGPGKTSDIHTCSSDAKDGGLEFGSNRMSGWMSWVGRRMSGH